MVAGEPFWRKPPEPADAAASGYEIASFGSHASNVTVGIELCLTFLYTLVSSEDDWDRYEGLQWRAAERYAAAHPDDPDAAEIVARQRIHRDNYLRWERDTLGWAMYVFQVPV